MFFKRTFANLVWIIHHLYTADITTIQRAHIKQFFKDEWLGYGFHLALGSHPLICIIYSFIKSAHTNTCTAADIFRRCIKKLKRIKERTLYPLHMRIFTKRKQKVGFERPTLRWHVLESYVTNKLRNESGNLSHQNIHNLGTKWSSHCLE